MGRLVIAWGVVLLAGLVIPPLILVSDFAASPALLPAATAARQVEVLNTYSHWRCFVTMRPTVFGTQAEAKPELLSRRGPMNWTVVLPEGQPSTPLPPDDWKWPDFDDRTWWLDPGPFFGGANGRGEQRVRPHFGRYGAEQPTTLALLCARGKFQVNDPAAVKSLTLSVTFRGGLVAYLNGQEVARAYLPEGDVAAETLADDYPWSAYVDANGKLQGGHGPGMDRQVLERRVRQVERIDIPAALLRAGVNVLALEVHRAAMRPELLTMSDPSERGRWNTVGLMDVRLAGRVGPTTRAALAELVGGIDPPADPAIVPNTIRPDGIQVWNASALKSVFDSDYGEPNEPVRPIRIEAARNGIFSGQVVVGSRSPLAGFRAEIGPLKLQPPPAASSRPDDRPVGTAGPPAVPEVAVFYPRATVVESGGKWLHPVPADGDEWKSGARRFDLLDPAPPGAVEVPDLAARQGKAGPTGLADPLSPSAGTGEIVDPPPWLGAVQPVWLKVRVPADAAPGEYAGELTIRLRGVEPIRVPVSLAVHDFRLPDPDQFQTWVDFVESPEALAEYYKVPLWSDEHWKLVAQSLRFLAEVRAKVLYVPLICRTNLGNRQGLVRWKPGPDGTYQYDFSILERYLDLALDAGVRPEVVCLVVWDYHVGRNPQMRIGTGGYNQSEVNQPMPVPVSFVDPDGTVRELAGPRYGDPAAADFWRPVAQGVHDRLRDRCLEDAMMLGLVGDYVPPKETIALWADLLPGAQWSFAAHGRISRLYGAPMGYGVSVFGGIFPVDPAVRRFYGWNRKDATAWFARYKGAGSTYYIQPADDRLMFEFALVSNLRGVGRLSLDLFDVPTFPESEWGSLHVRLPALAAGPAGAGGAAGAAGPASTVRFEMDREGIQECEARIYLERALLDSKARSRLGTALADKCQAILDERTRCIIWAQENSVNATNFSSLPMGPLGFDWYAAGSGWEARSAKLFDVAGEVARVLGH